MTESIIGKRFLVKDMILKVLIYLCAAFSVGLLLGIVGYVVVRGLPALSIEFLTSVPSTLKGTFGILGNIVNTLYIVVITLIIATPVGIGGAIYLTEYAKKGKLVKMIEFTTETLSGIPSIIYGLFGMVFFGIGCKLGFSIICGCLTLSLMVLPIIVSTTREALKTVPQSYRSGAMGMGAGKWYMIRTIILPSSLPGIITGVILSIGRIVGESAALLFTAGSGYLLPKALISHIGNPGGTLTIQMYLQMAKAEYDNAFGIALVLLVVVLAINGLTKLLGGKRNEN